MTAHDGHDSNDGNDSNDNLNANASAPRSSEESTRALAHESHPDARESAARSDENALEAASSFATDPGEGLGFADADRIAQDEHAFESALGVAEIGEMRFDGTDSHDSHLSDDERAALAEADQESQSDADDAAAAYARASMRDFDVPVETTITPGDEPVEAHHGEKPKQLVIVNDTPGDEIRIAILEGGKLAQFYSERSATATNVGSIYKARVVNVEPAIQAAFVDFGEGANGFLHISDLHPKYFPGESDKTEKVGRKIPRRNRPMMQEALRRGQEITVQVLKEGLGSKGPTVTSYLSIPGRLLVMMPDMDNVGVSRKVDDEEGRRKMRKILDSLNLPEGFGFILRTAGFDATRTELARDAQYLQRLWEVMDKRSNAVGAPCGLYTEGDILLRTIRDAIDASVDGIVVDSESAFNRAKAFLEVVSPRTAAKVHYYDRRMPIFHAFDVERQVDLIHSREVPLPSGGALVIDQAEALVAIDVNSGRSRSARDSETNAYQTNQEAVDEIARQLRLRDLGGVVISDLIDMRFSKHRQDIEERMLKNLARDRAKTTINSISEFGILEMTRQRMRPSLRKSHYIDCPHCAGVGEIRMPDSVASDAMRRIQFVLDMNKVARLEVVCSARVAAVMLSSKRRAMVEMEDLFGKKVDVRISDAIAVDRVDLYAYDDRNADVELDRPQRIYAPTLASLPTEIEEDDASDSAGGDGSQERGEQGGRRRRGRGRRRKPAAADATSLILSGGFDDLPDIDEDEPSVSDGLDRDEEEGSQSGASPRESGGRGNFGRGGSGRGRGGRNRGGAGRSDAAPARVPSAAPTSGDDASQNQSQGEGGGRGGRGGRRRGRGRGGRDRAQVEGAVGEGASEGASDASTTNNDGARPDQGRQQGRQQGGQQGQRQPRMVTRRRLVEAAPREPSEAIRVHAIAKEIELPSKDILAKCAELEIEVKGHQSLLSGEQGDAVRKAYGKPPFDVSDEVWIEELVPADEDGADGDANAFNAEGGEAGEGGRKRRRRRRGRGGRGGADRDGDGSGAQGNASDGESSDESAGAATDGASASSDEQSHEANAGDENAPASDGTGDENGNADGGESRGPRRRRGRGGRGRGAGARGGESAGTNAPAAQVGNSDGGDVAQQDRPQQDRGNGGNNGGGNRGGDNRGGNNRGGDNRGGDNRGGNNRGGNSQGGGNRGGDNRGGNNQGGGNRGGGNRQDGGRVGNQAGASQDNRGESNSAKSGDGRDNSRGGRDGGRDGGRGGRGGRGGGGGGRSGGNNNASSETSRAPAATPAPVAPPTPAPEAVKPPKPRSLYGGRVRKLSPGEMPKGGGGDE